MLVSTKAFVEVNGIVRHLGTDLPAAQSAFIHFAFGLMVLAPAIWTARATRFPVPVLWMFGWRGALHVAAVILWFYAMARVPVAEMATLGHYTMTRAFGAAPLAVTQPVTFLQIVWAALLGALVFGERVDAFVLLGGAMIVGAVSLNTWAEARRGRIPPRRCREGVAPPVPEARAPVKGH
ncbi:MAG: hypothetical protein C0524_08075 [Rhodobacter sp.]|nr:hypothetical protein [Rhodobacter sp.]